MDMDNLAAMEVLKEIKSLMDSKLGDKLSGKPEEEGGLEISKVKVLGGESPIESEESSSEEMMDPNEMEELKKIRSSMME